MIAHDEDLPGWRGLSLGAFTSHRFARMASLPRKTRANRKLPSLSRYLPRSRSGLTAPSAQLPPRFAIFCEVLISANPLSVTSYSPQDSGGFFLYPLV